MGKLYIMTKIAIYCRTSTQEQNTENQKIQLIEFAKSKNWDFDIFEEKETTRKTRPIKEKVLALLRAKRYSTLLVWKLDRWGRSLVELALEIEELHNKNINFISLKDSIDLSTAGGKLQFHIICSFAEFERSIISERTKAGLLRAKTQGKKLGRPKKDKNVYNHYCYFPKCRIRIEQNRRLCDKHLKHHNRFKKVTKKGGL